MAIATVGCPKCKQTFRNSDDVLDTKIRCPLCGFGFVVKEFVEDGGPKIAAQKPKPPDDDDEEEFKGPIGMTTVDLAPRCPNCANEMINETAIICIYCGYNTQTRTLGTTKRVVEQTGGDKFKWLAPGIGCLIGGFVLIFLHCYVILVLGRGSRGQDNWMANYLFTEPIFLWMTMINAGILWGVGQFAFKRLILEPTPPEEKVD